MTALRKSGINNFRFHDLRHIFASHMAMSDIDLNMVRELQKHAVDVLDKKIDTFLTQCIKSEVSEHPEMSQVFDNSLLTNVGK